MPEHHPKIQFRVVGIHKDGTRDARYKNLSRDTAEQVRKAMLVARCYSEVVVEEQLRRNPSH